MIQSALTPAPGARTFHAPLRILAARAAATLLLAIWCANPAAAQLLYESAQVTPFDIFGMQLGPRTQPVAMQGYLETDAYPVTWHVSAQTGSDTEGDGSPSAPWASIHHALSRVHDARLSRRHAILVARGTYTGGTFEMKEFVHLYGGFDPADWSRDIERNPTVLDGEGRGRVAICANEAKLDGFHVRNGVIRGKGGGLLCQSTSPVISNNVFTGNRTLAPMPWTPEFIHEIANDGGAIAALDGAAPRIRHNLFVDNGTESGRGGAIAAHNHSPALISGNVFMGNRAGSDDAARSSDGGAVSAAFHSAADIFHNVMLGNRADGTNDGGAVFTERWSPIRVGGNVIVDNASTDDGGGIYLSGQIHHYITEKEPLPPAERFTIRIVGNTLVANRNSSGGFDSGFRFTLDTRVAFERNVTYANHGGVDFRMSEVHATGNVFHDTVTVRETDYPNRFSQNLIVRHLDDQVKPLLRDTPVFSTSPEPGTRAFGRLFTDDGQALRITASEHDPARYLTELTLARPLEGDPAALRNRVVRLDGERWSVVHSAEGRVLRVWGAHEGASQAAILPTFRIRPGAGYDTVLDAQSAR